MGALKLSYYHKVEEGQQVVPIFNLYPLEQQHAALKNRVNCSPFGVTLHGRDLSLSTTVNVPYNYGFNGMIKDDEIKDGGNSYDFGARMLDPRIGRWLTIDPSFMKYPSHSAYNFVLNSPIVAIDPDGREVKPIGDFKYTSYYSVYQNLISDNSIYLQILRKYLPLGGNFNFYLRIDDGGHVDANARAETWSQSMFVNGVFTGVKSNSYYTDEKMTTGTRIVQNVQGHWIQEYYEETNIAKAKTLIHEAIHAMMAAERKVNDDQNHNNFSKYQSLLFKGLVEYNEDNKLGLSNEDLEALSWSGIHNSDAFKQYIQNRATKSGNSYDDEYKLWHDQVDKISKSVYDSVDLTEEEEQKEGVWDEGGEFAPK